jgi:hypothetical protein
MVHELFKLLRRFFSFFLPILVRGVKQLTAQLLECVHCRELNFKSMHSRKVVSSYIVYAICSSRLLPFLSNIMHPSNTVQFFVSSLHSKIVMTDAKAASSYNYIIIVGTYYIKYIRAAVAPGPTLLVLYVHAWVKIAARQKVENTRIYAQSQHHTI